jgi:hypothetical protein
VLKGCDFTERALRNLQMQIADAVEASAAHALQTTTAFAHPCMARGRETRRRWTGRTVQQPHAANRAALSGDCPGYISALRNITAAKLDVLTAKLLAYSGARRRQHQRTRQPLLTPAADEFEKEVQPDGTDARESKETEAKMEVRTRCAAQRGTEPTRGFARGAGVRMRQQG